MLNSDAACSLLSNTNEVVKWIGTARAPVDGSGDVPACNARVSKPGSAWPGMVSPLEMVGFSGCRRCELWAILNPPPLPGAPHESQRHSASQGRHVVYRLARSDTARSGERIVRARHRFARRDGPRRTHRYADL